MSLEELLVIALLTLLVVGLVLADSPPQGRRGGYRPKGKAKEGLRPPPGGGGVARPRRRRR